MSKPSSSCHSHGSSFLDKQVIGTTTLVVIGDDMIHVITDVRGTGDKAPYMILEENALKTFPISSNVLATMSGDPIICRDMLTHVKRKVEEDIREKKYESTIAVDVAATFAHDCIGDWQTQYSKTFPSDAIIVGFSKNVPSAYDLRSADLPMRTQDHGDGFVQGSGEPYVQQYYKEMENPKQETPRRSNEELAKIGKRAALYAALNDRSTGGGVRSSEVRSDMIHHAAIEENLKVLHDNYDKFKTYLSRFLFCLYRKSDFEYAADTETKLSTLIHNRFKSETQRSHVFQTKDKYFIRILQFKDEKVAQEEYQSVVLEWNQTWACGHTQDTSTSPSVRSLPWIMFPQLRGTPLVFALPTKKNISLFLDL